MSDGMSDGYRMEQAGRRRDEREAADSDYDQSMDGALISAAEAIRHYMNERDASLEGYGPYGVKYDDEDRKRMKDILKRKGIVLASRLRQLANALEAKL